MRRVIVIGCPGAGKSWFARGLARASGLPLHYLDQIWHLPNRTCVSREIFDEKLGRILQGERWIIDGNYLRTLERRLAACDTVFLLDLPVELCLAGAASRIGKEREDLPWVEDAFDEEFRRWILDFERDQMPEIRRLLARYRAGRRIVVFRTREEGEAFLRAFSADKSGGEIT